MSYGRGVPGRGAQRTRRDSWASVPQRERSAPVRADSAPLRGPGLSGPTGVATPHALLPNISAATAFLESRTRARAMRENGEAILDSLQFLRVNDVCRLLRISKPTLWRLRRANAFPEPTELTDRVIAWRRSEVEAWLRARNAGGRSSTAQASNQPPPRSN